MTQPQRRQTSSLLGRYSETLGELTLRRQSELAMNAARIESDLANRAKSAFLGTVSHELRTPLNAIIGFSDLIRSAKSDADDETAKNADYAAYIGDAGRHLLAVVSDILDISKIESGTFALDLEPCSIAQLVGEALPMVAPRIEEKRQKLDVRIQRRIPQLDLDARRIKQILINLLSNASKFTPEEGKLTLAARGNKDGGVTIAVVDTGIGMAPEEIVVAMTPFGQIQSHLSRSHQGTGLGLPIARGLARQHGGDLYLESEPDCGTSAVLTLPPNAPPPGAGRVGRPPGGGERRRARKVAHST
ncbi:MAG TPA: ATP-binding protein [Caulobacteraceae bacterium]|nr:ATP-binding protein [Caulobacteraceae bacterium]